MAITAQLEKLKVLGNLRDLDRGDWLRLWSEHGPMVVSALLVMLIAAVFAANVLRLLAPTPAPSTDGVADIPRAAPSVDLGSIINAHLFGAAPAPQGDPSSAPATSMNLFLAGTIAGSEPELGWAIIGESAMSARVVRAGAQVPGGAILKAVYPDRVILDLGGRLESLLLPRLAGGAVMPTRQGPGAGVSVFDAVRTAVGNPQALTASQDLVRPQPVFENGSLRGVRAYPGRNRLAFQKFGLQPGDLVTAINGAQIEEVHAASAALRNLGNEPVQLTVERNGAAQVISVDPAAVAQALAGNASNGKEAPPEGEP